MKKKRNNGHPNIFNINNRFIFINEIVLTEKYVLFIKKNHITLKSTNINNFLNVIIKNT